MSEFTVQLQKMVDDYRAHCAKALPVPLSIGNIPGVTGRLDIDVIPDGVSWIVSIRCGDKMLLPEFACDPQSFLDNLYTNIVACIRTLRAHPTKPS
jgi:hypothetical protein